MDIMEKARIRMDHWITHNDHHLEEYEMLAEQLEEAGKNESSKHIREMIEIMVRGNESLRKALDALK